MYLQLKKLLCYLLYCGAVVCAKGIAGARRAFCYEVFRPVKEYIPVTRGKFLIPETEFSKPKKKKQF